MSCMICSVFGFQRNSNPEKNEVEGDHHSQEDYSSEQSVSHPNFKKMKTFIGEASRSQVVYEIRMMDSLIERNKKKWWLVIRESMEGDADRTSISKITWKKREEKQRGVKRWWCRCNASRSSHLEEIILPELVHAVEIQLLNNLGRSRGRRKLQKDCNWDVKIEGRAPWKGCCSRRRSASFSSH